MIDAITSVVMITEIKFQPKLCRGLLQIRAQGSQVHSLFKPWGVCGGGGGVGGLWQVSYSTQGEREGQPNSLHLILSGKFVSIVSNVNCMCANKNVGKTKLLSQKQDLLTVTLVQRKLYYREKYKSPHTTKLDVILVKWKLLQMSVVHSGWFSVTPSLRNCEERQVGEKLSVNGP